MSMDYQQVIARTAMDFQQNNTALFKTDFCLLMTNQILLKQIENGTNFVSSPLSVHVILGLLAAGSTGQTSEQLLSFLGSKSIGELNQLMSSQINSLLLLVEGGGIGNEPTAGPTYLFANGVWVDQRFGLKPSFGKLTRDIYKAKAEQVDFLNRPDKVGDEVNSWAEKATKGLIKEVLPSGSVDWKTALILANVLYFKGAWDQQFEPSLTQDRDFYLLDGQIVGVPFMTGKKYERYLYRSFDGYRILQLPYQCGQENTRQFSMFFFLPDEKDGLPNLVKMFKSKPGFFNQQFNLSREDLPDFWIPRFKFSFEFEASEIMKEMGLQRPFYPGEFTEMVDSPMIGELHLSKVFLKSYIEVNEEGTEAAASTAATMRWLCATYPTPSFVADHPFMFMIREEATRTVFFTGAVLNPFLEQ